jgi:hypothetical protein
MLNAMGNETGGFLPGTRALAIIFLVNAGGARLGAAVRTLTAYFGNRPTAFRKPPARRTDRTLLFSTLSATAHVQPADEPSDHENRHQENDDHASADEQIGENKTDALLDDHAARSRADSLFGSR